MYAYHADSMVPKAGYIFVFGSNMAGRHGKGAAKIAHTNFRAEYGVGFGRTGNAYAIPTKGKRLEVLSLAIIRDGVKDFLDYARANPSLRFFVTRIGCGLAGYKDEEIAPLFAGAPGNCSFAVPWAPYVDPDLIAHCKAAVGEP